LPAKIVVFMLWKRLYEISHIKRKLVRELPTPVEYIPEVNAFIPSGYAPNFRQQAFIVKRDVLKFLSFFCCL